LKKLAQAGMHVWLYLEDRERTLDSPTDKLLMSVTAFADELERERARQRTRDGAGSQGARGSRHRRRRLRLRQSRRLRQRRA